MFLKKYSIFARLWGKFNVFFRQRAGGAKNFDFVSQIRIKKQQKKICHRFMGEGAEWYFRQNSWGGWGDRTHKGFFRRDKIFRSIAILLRTWNWICFSFEPCVCAKTFWTTLVKYSWSLKSISKSISEVWRVMDITNEKIWDGKQKTASIKHFYIDPSIAIVITLTTRSWAEIGREFICQEIDLLSRIREKVYCGQGKRTLKPHKCLIILARDVEYGILNEFAERVHIPYSTTSWPTLSNTSVVFVLSHFFEKLL